MPSAPAFTSAPVSPSETLPQPVGATSIPKEIENLAKSRSGNDAHPPSDISDSISSILDSTENTQTPRPPSNDYSFTKPDSMNTNPPEDLLGAGSTSSAVETKPEKPIKSDVDDPRQGDLPNPLTGMGNWFKRIVSVLMEPQVLVRAVGLTILLGLAYVVADWKSYFQNIEDSMFFAFFGVAATVTLSLIIVGCAIYLATAYAAELIDYELNDVDKKDRWTTAFPESMFSKVLALSAGVWAGIFPGAFLGTLFYLMTESSVGMYLLMLISGMTLSPLFVLATTNNEQLFNIFSKDVMDSALSHRFRWLRFYLVSFAIFVLLALLSFTLFFNLFVVSFIVALITVGLGVFYTKMFAIQAHEILGYIDYQKKN